MIDVDRDQLVGRAFGAGEVQRSNAGAIQQARHPDLLTVWLVEDEVAVKVTNRGRAGKVRVANGRKRPCAHVVDVAVRVGRNEDLRAVVRNGHRAGAVDGAEKRRVVRRVNLVQTLTGHNVAVGAGDLRRPQTPDRAGADGSKPAQAWRAVEEGGLLAAFRYHLREQIDHATVRSVDAARDVG